MLYREILSLHAFLIFWGEAPIGINKIIQMVKYLYPSYSR